MQPDTHPHIARAADAVLVVVDVQEKLFPVIRDNEALARRIRTLMEGARLLGVPVIVTEQYTKGLGKTIPALREAAEGATVLEKLAFSCGRDDGFTQALRDTERRQVILCGIETHICVMQTALDVIAQGWDAFVVTDATGTRLPQSQPVGLERMRAAGAIPTTTEGVLFELMERCDHDAFKSILGLVREGS